MKRLSGTVAKGLVIGLLAVALLFVTGAWAKPTTPEQAKTVVANWLGLDSHPLGSPLGQQVKEVQTFSDDSGNPLYYVVYLSPSGFVLVSGEDLVEPIIGFQPTGTYDPSLSNPLGALVSGDVPNRVQQARQMEAQAMAAGTSIGPLTPQATAQQKWALLENPSATMGTGSGIASVSDLRVAPFIQTHWSQTTTDDTTSGAACYNYYTFPYAPGDPTNYPCGCVATAMGQLMYYWTHPTSGVGTAWFTVTVDKAPVEAQLRGGDGNGNPYDWADMVLNPVNGTSLIQRQAIGNLLRDAGVAVKMQYTAASSGAYMEDAVTALVNVFGYHNAIVSSNYDNSGNALTLPYTNRNAMINPNLQAKYPVILGIDGSPGGHAIVCDGYGYNTQTMYHHLNMGWSGHDDAWYNLPLVYPSDISFNILDSIIYNVYITGSGEIIAGRVTDSGSYPLSGVTVSATGGYTATTDAYGIYALTKVPSNTTFTVTASKSGYSFVPQTVTTGKSANTQTYNSYVCGNIWGVDFVNQSSLGQALDNFQLSFTKSGDGNWYPQSSYWYYGGSAAQSGAISNGQSSTLQTTVVGPGVLSFYWASSSTPYYNRTTLKMDSTYVDMIAGTMGWAQKTVDIPIGQHIITWTYSKTSNVFGTLGNDCGWVDKVVFTSANSKNFLGPIYQLLLE